MLAEIFRNQLLIRQVGNITHHAGYKELWLGHGWSYLEPLIFATVYYFFVRLVRGGDAGATGTLLLTIISGQAVYDWFNKVITGSPNTIEKYKGIVLTMRINPVLLLAADFYYFFKSSLSRFVILFGALVLFGITPSFAWLLIVPVLLLIAIFLFPLATIVGIFGVYVKDVGHMMAVVARVMIFVTPVLFSLHDIPKSFGSVVALNPIAQLIEAVRDVLIREGVPSLNGIIYVLAISLAMWAVAQYLLMKLGPQLAKEI
jgi:lipopolysaccharide transport system permease protein